ncbi:MAG: hypothetical protein KAT65_28455 [Methanophagales archaeon]|nr:hypothetical protein [Methanophagales archaeon]
MPIDTTPPEITGPADVTVEQETQEGTGEMEARINAGGSENSTDISNVIQELVDSYDYFAAFEDAEYDAPKLFIEYSMAESTGGGSDIAPLQVTIISPDGGRTYTTTEIALAVTANVPISRWSYGLNGVDPLPVSFYLESFN